MKSQAGYYGSAIVAGALAGSLVWLWLAYGASVFLAMTEALLAWCL